MQDGQPERRTCTPLVTHSAAGTPVQSPWQRAAFWVDYRGGVSLIPSNRVALHEGSARPRRVATCTRTRREALAQGIDWE